ncbi:hypothetical protein QR680_014018 [Steinernema hermaphroditum]|uniref:RRM domain-containing protein n=1 Tax=Steinernema hermaphroditum TaxID=289476 RepID=A0AA39I7G4_9BILA|nr:hypothetical protein QR680_014018 [Steinernema hermaphroditum]
MASSSNVPLDEKNLYVKNIGDMSNEELQQLFGRFGRIASSVVMKDRDGRPKGYGFVAFEREEDAENALKAMHNVKIGARGEKPLHVARAQVKERRTPRSPRGAGEDSQAPTTLFMRNLHESVDEGRLVEVFTRFGEILSVNVRRHPSGISKRQGSIVFRRRKDAQRAMNEMNGRDLNGSYVYLEYAMEPVAQPFVGGPYMMVPSMGPDMTPQVIYPYQQMVMGAQQYPAAPGQPGPSQYTPGDPQSSQMPVSQNQFAPGQVQVQNQPMVPYPQSHNQANQMPLYQQSQMPPFQTGQMPLQYQMPPPHMVASQMQPPPLYTQAPQQQHPETTSTQAMPMSPPVTPPVPYGAKHK